MTKIKVGYLVSYDYEFLMTSLKQVYDYSDNIYLSIDKNRLTYSGNKIEIPNTFFEQIKIFDIKRKIHYHFDNFYMSGLTPMESETRQRNLLLKEMGRGWLIQLDVDEYVLNFKEVVGFLKKNALLAYMYSFFPVMIQGNWVSLLKKNENGFFVINKKERFNFITNYPYFTLARNNSNITKLFIEVDVVHQSWARTEEDILKKVMNWSHRDDFDTLKFMELWKSIDIQNYKKISNFHPLNPNLWDYMNFVKAKNIEDFIKIIEDEKRISYNKLSLTKIFKENSIIKFKNFKIKLKTRLKYL
jgi:hypothetical protein